MGWGIGVVEIRPPSISRRQMFGVGHLGDLEPGLYYPGLGG